MVAKDEKGNNADVPTLEITPLEEVRRFFDCVRRINHQKKYKVQEEIFDHKSPKVLNQIQNFNNILSKILKKQQLFIKYFIIFDFIRQ